MNIEQGYRRANSRLNIYKYTRIHTCTPVPRAMTRQVLFPGEDCLKNFGFLWDDRPMIGRGRGRGRGRERREVSFCNLLYAMHAPARRENGGRAHRPSLLRLRSSFPVIVLPRSFFPLVTFVPIRFRFSACSFSSPSVHRASRIYRYNIQG